jgi:hypothetical protein
VKIFGSIQELVELVYRKGSNTVTLKPNASQAANVTVSLPVLTTDDTIVTEAKAQALSNKTSIGVGSLTLSSANISSAGDLGLTAVSGTVKIYSPVYLFGGNSLTLWDFDNSNSIAISVPGTVTANRTPQIPDASGDFVLTTATQTLTNKTISGSSNTLTNLPAASITGILPAANGGTGVNSSATFPSTGTVAVLTDISASQLSGIVPGSKGGTGINNGGTLTYGTNNITLSTSGVTSLTLPTSGTLATLAGSETLLNKLISSTGAITGALTLPSGTQAERPSPVAGMIRYNTSSSSFEGYANGVWSGIGGGGTTDLITQVAHGFVVGDVLYLNGSTYAKANATAAATAEVVGVVSRVIGVDQFELTLSGEISGLTSANFTEAALPAVGEAIFLSTTAGKMTITEPTTIGQVSVPVGVRSVGADTMYVAPKRGAVVGGTNARAQVSLTSGATTNVQNLAGYDAGEITGWVFISSAAPVRFYLSAKFAKSGSGGDYNLSYSTTGDTPPTGFLVDITTTGIIRVTLPASSGSTSVINYALNAPAIGASFPLTVNADTILSGTVAAARLPSPTVYADAEATRMGLKSYLHGTAYNGGVSPTITLTGGGGSLTSVIRSSFIPYQLQDGRWRLKANFNVQLSGLTRVSVDFSINGITIKNTSLMFQPIIGYQFDVPSATVGYCYASPNSSALVLNHSSAATTVYGVSGDIELESKPTWAY